MSKMNMAQALNNALFQMMETDQRVVVLGEDVGKDGGVFRITEGLLERFGEQRVIDTPLAESLIVGASIGMAIGGLRPVCEIQFMGFIYQGFDQILCHAARMLHRSQGKYPVPMVVRAPYGAGVRALEHHCESTEAHFAHIPGLTVVIPSNAFDAKGLLISAIEDPGPVIFLEPKRIYRNRKEEVPDEIYRVPIGKAKVVQVGEQVSVIAYGSMLPFALEAALTMAKKDVGVEVIDLRTIIPFDLATITESVKKTGRAVIVHEGTRSFGVGAEIVAQINERCLLQLLAPVIRVTSYDIVPPLGRLEDYNMPSVDRIVEGIEKTLEF